MTLIELLGFYYILITEYAVVPANMTYEEYKEKYLQNK